jgi:hypothetical protein
VPQSVIKYGRLGGSIISSITLPRRSMRRPDSVEMHRSCAIIFTSSVATLHVLKARWRNARGLPIAGRSKPDLSSRLGRRGGQSLVRSLWDAVMANAHRRHRSASRSNLGGSYQAHVEERIRGAGCVRISPTG